MKESSIKKISLTSWFNVAEKESSYETYRFIFDFENNKGYFKEKEIYGPPICIILNEESKNIFKDIHSFYTEEIINLNNLDMDELNSVIKNFKEEYKKNPLLDCDLTVMVFYSREVEYFNQGSEYFTFFYDEIPSKLFEIFEKGIGFDVFNSDNIKKLVTEKDYFINKNGIHNKQTGKELILKKMDYSEECGDLFTSTVASFHLDFEENELITHGGKKITHSDHDIKNIVSLIKKFGVFKWNFIEYSKKAINSNHLFFGGCSWILSLVFDGGEVLNFGGHNMEQDTYMDFGAELFNMFGIDLLNIAGVIIE
ncbi:MAG: hypothetical protein Q4P18_04885 [Methanobrevibacter sp.]|uniref:hypothetical protein n=1 Tax=Methanobrevibacter sp. TaxID=66852 RepID=UPI0026E00CAC|nr:hypothetical protein [Methanobrevibacter sp.]MDO5848847.1 hypothetical protein [Methanobrevibacter sp.]